MVEFKDFQKKNRQELLDMMMVFYKSDAVDEPIADNIIKKLLDDILKGEYQIRGIELYYDSKLAGFGIITSYYTSEIAGTTVQFEDVYIKDEYRSKGIGRKYFPSMMKEYPNASRFRLEVAPENERAIKLYKELGFEKLDYNQMISDM
ncbi:GNAT family N-acetyltransferase [Peptostreptococcus faecalis]|uniref:GNAT family N-acetyltransferase n=1 Tax=Peptostreptococcus faecalis TaxID=2045015 RepID=UPI000C7D3269|nr:GNAT family N-acetyltransferase [Peptostreptococcus faecalis]